MSNLIWGGDGGWLRRNKNWLTMWYMVKKKLNSTRSRETKLFSKVLASSATNK